MPNDDNDVVHKTGDEVIGGEKIFSQSTFLIKNPDISFLTAPESGNKYAEVFFVSSEFTSGISDGQIGVSRLGEVQYRDSQTYYQLGLSLRTREAGSNIAKQIGIVYDRTSGSYAGFCPSTPERSNGTDIVTRDWIPKDTRIIHSTGDEEKAGRITETTKDKGFRCTYSTTADMEFKIGTGGTNRGFWDYILNDWVVYCTATAAIFKGTVSGSSDERLKTTLEDISDNVLDAWDDIEWKQFKYLSDTNRSESGAPVHVGLGAQTVASVFSNYGIDAEKYDFICQDENEDGTKGYWSIRYIEALSIEAAYQRRRASRAEARITELEQRLNSLEEKLVGKD